MNVEKSYLAVLKAAEEEALTRPHFPGAFEAYIKVLGQGFALGLLVCGDEDGA